MDNLWLSDQKSYSNIVNESRKYLLYPELVGIINRYEPTKIIDYGCGDGSFVECLDKNYDISLYDISDEAIKVAKKRLSNRKIDFYNSNIEIPSNKFDIVIFSLVLITIDNEKKVIDTLNDLSRIKKKNGKVIIAVTHPCFRQQKFSSFYTEYTNKKVFDYFEEGQEFQVTLEDLSTHRKLSFFDYHWSLSKTINCCVECGLQIERLIELKDMSMKGGNSSSSYPPYLIIICG